MPVIQILRDGHEAIKRFVRVAIRFSFYPRLQYETAKTPSK